MKKWSIGKKLWFLSGCLVASIVLQGVIGYYFSGKLSHALHEISDRELPALKHMASADMAHDAIRSVAYRSILAIDSKDADEKADIRRESEELIKGLNEDLSALKSFALDEEVISQVDALLPVVKEYEEQADKIVKAALMGQRAQAEAYLPDLRKHFSALEVKLAKLSESIEAGEKETQLRADHAVELADTLQILLMVIGVAVGSLVAYFTVRELIRAIREVMENLALQADNVSGTATDLETASQSLSSATTEQAAALQETASAIEEMNAMVKKSAENASKSSEVAGASQEVAGKGKRTVEEMLTSINEISVSNGEIMRAVEHSNGQIAEIVKVITEIGNKTKVINDIVFQTKLLSFNASVEAARAGEHGKGFAVVAEEVGNLAQMSGNAAKEISDMLSGSIQKVERIVTETKEQVGRLVAQGKSKVDSGSVVAKECAEILDEMVKNVGEVAEMISEISTAATEQAQGVSEITKAMNQLDQTTHENAATSQQAASSAEQLSGQANKLLGVVDLLKLIVDGKVEGSSHVPHRATKPSTTEKQSSKTPIKWKSHVKSKISETSEAPPRAKAVGASELPAEDDPRFQDL